MRPALATLLFVSACHDGAVVAQQKAPSSASTTARATQLQRANGDTGPVNEGGLGASAGYAEPKCPGPVFVRARNASTVDFDSVEIDGVALGPVRVGAHSAYQRIQGCVYGYGSMQVTAGKQRFLALPSRAAYTRAAPLNISQRIAPPPGLDGPRSVGHAHEPMGSATRRANS